MTVIVATPCLLSSLDQGPTHAEFVTSSLGRQR